MENLNINENTIQISVEEYKRFKALEAREEELNKRIELLEEALRLAKQKRFGKSSEKISPESSEQLLYLFDEAETILAIEDIKDEEETTSVASHTRRKYSNTLGDKLPENVPVEVVEHTLSYEELACPTCGTQMQEIGVDIRRELVIIPATIKVVEHRIHSYACMKCKEEELQTPIRSAEKEPALISGGFATAEAAAYIMTQKFVMGSPLYRQEMEWRRQGIELSRQTMSNWILKCAEIYLQPLYNKLHEKLLSRDVIHADETTLQVLKQLERPNASKCYMWLYRTGSDAENAIVLYDYQAGRGKEYPQKFLAEYEGYLQTDGYSVYHDLSDKITNVGCWAHLRRKFDEAKKALPKGKSAEASAAMKAMGYFTKIYKLEKKFAKLSFEERYTKRLKEEKPILDEFLSWAKTLNVAPKSALGKALVYLFNQEPYLINYLKDGRLEIDNNRAERSIKPFVIDRKNFLFANTARGAQGSAVIFSIIETAKENKLDPYRYLVYVLKQAKELHSSNETNWVEQLLPENAPDECKVNSRC